MNIIVSAEMKKGTFEAKFVPISRLDLVETVYVVRKEKGPDIPKIKYLILPRVCKIKLIGLLVIPFFLLYYSIKCKPKLLISYHIIPHAFYVCLVSKILKKPYIVTQTGGHIQILVRKYVLIRKIIRYILDGAHRVHVPGEQSRKFWAQVRVPATKVKVLHSTIDTELFIPADQDAQMKYDFIFVGKLNARKQVEKILDGFKIVVGNHPSARMVIIGEGPLESQLKAQAQQLEIDQNVEFVGFQNDVRVWLQKSKIFIMASKVEGLPVALMEAMACEKLVIAPLVDNIPSVLDSTTGLPFTSQDIENLGEIMLFAYQKYAVLSEVRRQGRLRIVEKYSYQRAMNYWTGLLNEKTI